MKGGNPPADRCYNPLPRRRDLTPVGFHPKVIRNAPRRHDFYLYTSIDRGVPASDVLTARWNSSSQSARLARVDSLYIELSTHS